MPSTADRRAALDLVRAVHAGDDHPAAALDHQPADVALALVEHLLLLAHETDTDIDVWADALALDLADERTERAQA